MEIEAVGNESSESKSEQESEQASEQKSEDGLQCLTSSLLHTDQDDGMLRNKSGSGQRKKEKPQSSASDIRPPAQQLPKEIPQSSAPNIRPPANKLPQKPIASPFKCCQAIVKAPEEVLEKHGWPKVAGQLDEAIQCLEHEPLSTCLRGKAMEEYDTFTKQAAKSALMVRKSIVNLHLKDNIWKEEGEG